ncbi:phage head morphogenesis protein [Candidatus Accumulibacter contiguus]|nr:phage minor head protein [Candidatus Accumulibacter contiguus]
MSTYHQPFAEQLEFFRRKLNLSTQRWDDILEAEHDKSFIVAGAQAADLLADLNAAILKTRESGVGLNVFRKDFKEIVARHGWTGWTGEGSQAGVAWRTKVIYQTNMATSYAAGQYQQLTSPGLLKILPYWQYKHADGILHPRPLHQSWNGLTLSHDHEFWKAHFPPNGWGCHCRITAVSKRDYLRAIAEGRGPANAPAAGDTEGIDRGFAYTPGASVADELKALVTGKVATLPGPIGRALAGDAERLAERRTLDDTLDQAAERIAGAQVEHLFVFNAAGQQRLHKTGNASAVELSPDELEQLPGQVLLHNHPGVPQSFSVEDVHLAIWHDLAEMHVVDRLYRYRLARPPGELWGPEVWAKMQPLWSSIQEEVTQRLNHARESGMIQQDQYDVLREHMIWTEFNAAHNIGYSRTPRTTR